MKSIETLIVEFGSLYEQASRFRSEAYSLNVNLKEKDTEKTLYDYRKVKSTYNQIRNTMADLNRLIAKINAEEGFPSHEA